MSFYKVFFVFHNKKDVNFKFNSNMLIDFKCRYSKSLKELDIDNDYR